MSLNYVTYVGTLTTVGGCCGCGIEFAAPEEFVKARRRDHQTFYCPAGHAQHFPHKSDVEELKDKLAAVRSQRDQAKKEAEHAEARRRGEKAAKTRLQKRVAAGVCPCCKRSFSQLASHMAAKHPGWPDA